MQLVNRGMALALSTLVVAAVCIVPIVSKADDGKLGVRKTENGVTPNTAQSVARRQIIALATSRPSLDIRQVYRKKSENAIGMLLSAACQINGPAPFSAVPVTQISHGSRGGRRVALTFDVESGTALPQILDALKAANKKATFFVLGGWAAANPELTRRIANEGHEIANHSYNHPRFTAIPNEAVVSELTATDQTLFRITNHPPSRLFRPPYGFADVRVVNAVASKGFKTVFWSTDPDDWLPRTPESVLESVMGKVSAGDIVVMHTSRAATGQVLPMVLEKLSATGIQQVTVSSLLDGE